MYVLVQFGLVTLPIYNRVGPFPMAPAKSTSVAVVGGSFDDQPDEQVFDFPYTVPWSAVVHESSLTALRTTVDALRPLVAMRSLLWRQALDDGSIQYADARLMSVLENPDTRSNYQQPISFQFEIYTHWHGGQIGEWFFDDGEYLNSGLYLDTTDGETELTGDDVTAVNCSYQGNIPQTDVTCTITNGTGASDITAITLTIGDTELDWTGTLAAGESLVIDGGHWSCELEGVDDYDSLSRGSGHALATWFKFSNGSNTGSVDLTGGAGGSTDPTINFGLFELYA